MPPSRIPPGALPAIDVVDLQLQVRDSYLPGTPMLVRVSAIDSDGNIEKDLWDAEALLTVDHPNVTLSSDRVTLVNGQGSVLVTVDGDYDFTLTASYRGTTTSKSIESVSDATVSEVSGTLSGSMTNWSGVVRVTGDITVPAGHMLNLEIFAYVSLETAKSPNFQKLKISEDLKSTWALKLR